MDADLGAGFNGRVDPDSSADREVERPQRSGLRRVIGCGVLGVEPDLDGMAIDVDGLLAELGPLRDGDLQCDQVDAEYLLLTGCST